MIPWGAGAPKADPGTVEPRGAGPKADPGTVEALKASRDLLQPLQPTFFPPASNAAVPDSAAEKFGPRGWIAPENERKPGDIAFLSIRPYCYEIWGDGKVLASVSVRFDLWFRNVATAQIGGRTWTFEARGPFRPRRIITDAKGTVGHVRKELGDDLLSMDGQEYRIPRRKFSIFGDGDRPNNIQIINHHSGSVVIDILWRDSLLFNVPRSVHFLNPNPATTEILAALFGIYVRLMDDLLASDWNP